MRFIKAFLVGVTGLFIIITLFSLLIPSKVRVSRAVLITNTSSGEIYHQIANFGNWKKWHPVFTVDSANLYRLRTDIIWKDSGCIIVHNGSSIAIKLISADLNSIKFLLQANGENDIENEIVITTLSSQQSVQVEWRAIITLNWYPWEKFYGIFVDKLTGPGYEGALYKLKEYIEKSPLSPEGGT